jgi:hypothetical protein
MRLLPPSSCERCGRGFGCGANETTCWCIGVELGQQARQTLAASYSHCLCPDCLQELATHRGDFARQS